MSIIPWDPWKEMQRLRTETDQLWDAFLDKLTQTSDSSGVVSFLPEVDVVETQHDVRVFMSMPGFVEDDIHIDVTVDTLTVRGEREPPYDIDRKHVREWRYGFFERRLTLDEPVDVQSIEATYDAGVLKIVLPKRNANPKSAQSRGSSRE